MFYMNKMFQKALVVGAALSLAATTYGADLKLGFVDLKKLFDKYYKTVQSSTAMKSEAEEMEKEQKEMIDSANRRRDEWQKLLDKANDQAISAEERDRNKRAAEEKLIELKSADDEIKRFDKMAQTKLMEKQRVRRDAIVGEISAVVKAKAKGHGYSAVLDTSGESANIAPLVLYFNGDNDMTDEVLKDLNAAAPAADASAAKLDGVKLNDK
jgi:Skp family chaperone for outer membrane proteins